MNQSGQVTNVHETKEDPHRRDPQVLHRLLLLIAIFVVLTQTNVAQEQATTRQSEALSLLGESLQAMTQAGHTVEESLAEVRASGQLTTSMPDGTVTQTPVEFVDDLSPRRHAYKRIWGQGDSSETIVSDGETAQRQKSRGKVSSTNDPVGPPVEPDYSPYAALWLALKNSHCDVRLLGATSFEGKSLTHISVGRPSGAGSTKCFRREWYLDSATKIPAYSLAISATPQSPFSQMKVRVRYSGYAACGIHICPMAEEKFVEGTQVSSLVITRVEFSTEKSHDASFRISR